MSESLIFVTLHVRRVIKKSSRRRLLCKSSRLVDLKNNLKHIKPNNKKNEYYLTETGKEAAVGFIDATLHYKKIRQ